MTNIVGAKWMNSYINLLGPIIVFRRFTPSPGPHSRQHKAFREVLSMR